MSSDNDAMPWLPPWLPQSVNATPTDQNTQADPDREQTPGQQAGQSIPPQPPAPGQNPMTHGQQPRPPMNAPTPFGAPTQTTPPFGMPNQPAPLFGTPPQPGQQFAPPNQPAPQYGPPQQFAPQDQPPQQFGQQGTQPQQFSPQGTQQQEFGTQPPQQFGPQSQQPSELGTQSQPPLQFGQQGTQPQHAGAENVQPQQAGPQGVQGLQAGRQDMHPPQASRPEQPLPPFGQQDQSAQPFGQQDQAAQPFGQQGQAAQPFGQQGQAAQPFGQQGQAAQPFGQQDQTVQAGRQDQAAQPFGRQDKAAQQAGAQSQPTQFGTVGQQPQPFGAPSQSQQSHGAHALVEPSGEPVVAGGTASETVPAEAEQVRTAAAEPAAPAVPGRPAHVGAGRVPMQPRSTSAVPQETDLPTSAPVGQAIGATPGGVIGQEQPASAAQAVEQPGLAQGDRPQTLSSPGNDAASATFAPAGVHTAASIDGPQAVSSPGNDVAGATFAPPGVYTAASVDGWQQQVDATQGVAPTAAQAGMFTPPAQFTPAQGYTQAPQGHSLTLDDVPLLHRAHKPPQSGWRRTVFQLSGGKVNLGQSSDELKVATLVSRVRKPARGDYRIAVLSLKGGVGKTTTTVALGSTFASLRGDRVIAVDANPDFGTLAHRVPMQTRSTVRHLLNDPNIQRYSDIRAHTSQAASRLEVLASERDPSTSEAFSEQEYRDVTKVLQRFYSVILTDCGTGLMHSAMAGVLDLAQTLVLVSAPAIDATRSAAATLDWLSQHGHEELVQSAVVVINSARPDSPNIGMDELKKYFLSRCRAVAVIPFDEHLATGSEIDIDMLDRSTRRAYLELAASVADDFGK